MFVRTDEPVSGIGGLQPAEGEDTRRTDRESVAPPADGVSHPFPPEAGSSVLTSEEAWLLAMLRRENLPEPSVKLSGTGKTWLVKSRGKKIGKLKHEAVLAQREDLVVKLAEQRRAVTLDLNLPLAPVVNGSKKKGMPKLQRDPDLTWEAQTGEFFAVSELIQAAMNRTTVSRVIADASGEGTSTHVLLSRAIAEVQADWKAKAAKAPEEKRAKMERRASVVLSGRTHDLVRKQVDDSLVKWQKNKLEERFPMRTGGQPIPLRAEAVQLRLTEEGGVDIGLSVTDSGWKYFGAQARGHAHRGLLERDYRVLGSKLKWDDKKKRWALHLTIALRRPKPAPGTGVMVVRVGVQDILYGVGTDGWVSYFNRSTDSLLHRKEGFYARRSKLQRLAQEPGSGRRGHGKKRRYREVVRERDYESRFVDTWWQQTAKQIADTALERRYSTVLVSDMTKPLPESALDFVDPRLAKLLRRFPSAAGRDAIVQACEKAGVTAEVIGAPFDAITCPACDCSDKVNYSAKTRGFVCVACELELPAQYVAGWNSLQQHGVDCAAVKKRGLTISKTTKELRERKRK